MSSLEMTAIRLGDFQARVGWNDEFNVLVLGFFQAGDDVSLFAAGMPISTAIELAENILAAALERRGEPQ